MLIFVILLHFGLKIMSLCAAITDDLTGTRVHICADYNPAKPNQTVVKWTVSSPEPVSVNYCDLAYSTGHEPTIINDGMHDITNTTIDLAPSKVWTIYVTCLAEEGNNASHSPSIQFTPGDTNSDHVCSDSGLGNLSSSTETGVVVCIWRSEINKTQVVVRWQPKDPQPTSTLCTLYRDLGGGQTLQEPGLPIDDFQRYAMSSSKMKAWLICNTAGGTLISNTAEYIEGGSNVCSEHAPRVTPSPTPSDGPTTLPTDQPSQDSPGTHSKLGISNMAMGLALAGSILIGGIIVAVGFIRWFRWQSHRRRERLLRNGNPAADQSAMDEFQQMM